MDHIIFIWFIDSYGLHHLPAAKAHPITRIPATTHIQHSTTSSCAYVQAACALVIAEEHAADTPTASVDLLIADHDLVQPSTSGVKLQEASKTTRHTKNVYLTSWLLTFPCQNTN